MNITYGRRTWITAGWIAIGFEYSRNAKYPIRMRSFYGMENMDSTDGEYGGPEGKRTNVHSWRPSRLALARLDIIGDRVDTQIKMVGRVRTIGSQDQERLLDGKSGDGTQAEEDGREGEGLKEGIAGRKITQSFTSLTADRCIDSLVDNE